MNRFFLGLAFVAAIDACADRTCAAGVPPLDAASSTASSAAPPAAPPPDREWYGGEILLAEAGAISLVLLATQVHGSGADEALGLGAAVLHYASGPVIHGLHGRRAGTILGSLGLRLGLPAGGLIIGAMIGAQSSCTDCSISDDLGSLGGVLTGMAYGAITGAALAGVLDAMLLAWIPGLSLKGATPSAPPEPSGPTIVPTFQVNREANGIYAPRLGLAGTF
jgi:hypothetical protein